MEARIEPFGRLQDGTKVDCISIAGGGISARVLNYGATLQDLRMDGVTHPLVLGSPTLEPYLDGMTYFGAVVGRFANRIAGGSFELEGTSYQIPVNWLDLHALHGGKIGTGQKVWRMTEHTGDRLRLEMTLPDGDMGFPGRLTAVVTYALPGNGVLDINIHAMTDAATPCSFAHHSYFNLDGSPDITDHELRILAEDYLPVDEELIPTGEVAHVEATDFDFRTAVPVGRRGLDHNFCLSKVTQPIRAVAELRSKTSGIAMAVETTEPGLQVYDGAYIPAAGLPGLDGRRYGPFAGIAMETQSWPDAPNRPDFPAAILRPGESYDHRVRYCFRRESNA